MVFAKVMRSEQSAREALSRALVKSGAAALAFALGVLAAAWSTGNGARAAQDRGAIKPAGPQYQSLSTDLVPLRNGPGRDFPISWGLPRAGLPVEVLAVSHGWRQVRDADGTTGWVSVSNLSARRTAIVLVQNQKPKASETRAVDLRQAASDTSKAVARLEAGRVLAVRSCDGVWCKVTWEGVEGYVAQRNLWGVNPGERVR